MSEGFEDVTYAVRDGIGSISLARPPVNAMRTRTWSELAAALRTVTGDPGCRVVVLDSALDHVFCAGADVKELPMTAEHDEARQLLARTTLEAVLRAPVPVVCAVTGPALGGGCALAAACDIRIASARATFGLPEINVGRLGGGRYLMRLLPPGELRHMYFTGEPIDAERALRLGMVHDVLPDAAQARAHALETAGRIAVKSPTALRLAKQSLDLSEELDVRSGYAVEQQFSLRLAGTPDAAEAANAFREKRQPRWPA